MKKVAKKRRAGLYIVILGAVVWLLPFMVVIVDNTIHTSRPADSVIGHFGLAVITVGPLLIFLGLIISAAGFVKRSRH